MNANNDIRDLNSDRLRLRLLMDLESLNQSQFAEKMGIKQSNLSEILSGKRPIGSNIINKLIISFGINPIWIMTGVGDVYTNNISKDTKIHDDNLWQRIEDLAIMLFSPDNDKTTFGVDCEKMGAETGISASRLYNIIRDNEYPTYTEIQNILNSKYINVNTEWLMTGKGSMLKSEGESTIDEPVKQNELPPTESNAVNYKLVPLLNLDAVGGMHSLNSEPGDSEYIDKLIPFTDAQDGDVALMVSGESMSPTCPSGSKVLIREVESWREYFGFGNIFVLLLTDGRRILKEVQKYPEDSKNYILCKSHNDKYPEEELPKSMIAGVWKVIKILNERGW